MCFSATGSFATAGVLMAIGGVSLSRASSKPLRRLAVIPTFFAAQQAAEGIVWLTIGDGTSACSDANCEGFGRSSGLAMRDGVG